MPGAARAQAMIREAFAERPMIAYGSATPELRVIAGHEVSQSVGEGMGSGKVIDAIPLGENEEQPPDGG
jgi:hypothetical protein